MVATAAAPRPAQIAPATVQRTAFIDGGSQSRSWRARCVRSMSGVCGDYSPAPGALNPFTLAAIFCTSFIPPILAKNFCSPPTVTNRSMFSRTWPQVAVFDALSSLTTSAQVQPFCTVGLAPGFIILIQLSMAMSFLVIDWMVIDPCLLGSVSTTFESSSLASISQPDGPRYS